MIIPALICGIILSVCSKSGEDKSSVTMRQSVPQEILGWKLQDATETYDRETIFDYMNGAGEVYRSYDFQNVIVFRFTKENNPEITVEIFDMGTPEDAYGVFSHARESEETGIGQSYEYRGSLLCFWQANFFVCVLAEKQTPETKEAVFALAGKIDRRLPSSGGRPELAKYLPEKNLIPQSVRYLHIHPSLNYHYFLAEQNILNLNHNTDAVLARYEPGETYLLAVKYPTDRLAENGYRSFLDNYIPEGRETGIAEIDEGKWVTAKFEQTYIIIVLDASTEEEATGLIEAFRSKLSDKTP